MESVNAIVTPFLDILTSPFINNQFRMYHHPSVVPPFPQRKVQDDKQWSYRDNSTRGCPHSRLIDGLSEGIQPCESRFGRNVWWSEDSYGRYSVIWGELSLAAMIAVALLEMHKLRKFENNWQEYEVKRLQLQDHTRESLHREVVVRCSVRGSIYSRGTAGQKNSW